MKAIHYICAWTHSGTRMHSEGAPCSLCAFVNTDVHVKELHCDDAAGSRKATVL